jgi:undecaprenyl-diphosphatase
MEIVAARTAAAPRRRVAAACLALFAGLALLVEAHVVDAADLRIERALASLVHRFDLVGTVERVYVSSEVAFLLLLGAGVGVAWLTGRVALRRLALEVPAALLAAEALARLLAPVIERPRPFVAHPDLFAPLEQAGLDPSFPSDGATAAFAIAAVVAVRCRRLALPALGIAALVAVGRLLVAVHYPSDVVGGALVGVAAAVLTCWLATRLTPHAARYAAAWRLRRGSPSVLEDELIRS